MKRFVISLALASAIASDVLIGWGAQGHRVVGLIAAERLTPIARRNVAWLIDGRTLADVASWADTITADQQQTSLWHYLNIPREAAGYDRDRDCPRQPGASAGSRGDRWRDCAVDRIAYWEERLASRQLDRADRATALKFIVHFVGDLHQPMHALGVGRGGNDVAVRMFGTADCSDDPQKPRPCNLHGAWDSELIARRHTTDRAYVAALQKLIVDTRLASKPVGTPAEWAEQSWRLAKDALVATGTNLEEGYYRRHIGVIDERLALGGVRLAAVLNRALTTPP